MYLIKTHNSKKLILFIVLSFIIYSFECQAQDVRQTNWGMSIESVKKTEFPQTSKISKEISRWKDNKVYYSGNIELIYEDIPAGNNHTATLTYYFKNNKLYKVKFVINPSMSELDTDLSLSDRFLSVKNFYVTFQKKQYKVFLGWNSLNYGLDCFDAVKCYGDNRRFSTNTEDIKYIENCSIKYNLDCIDYGVENERTYATMSFPIGKSEFKDRWICIISFRSQIREEEDDAF